MNKEELRERRVNKRAGEYLRTHPLSRWCVNIAIKLTMYGMTFLTPDGWGKLSDPMLRRTVFHRNARLGLLEGALIENPLFVPQENGSLECRAERAGTWGGYDPLRKAVLGRDMRRIEYKGRLWICIPPQIDRHETGEYTPLGLVDPFSVDIFSMEYPTMDEVIQKGLVEETTYGRAMRRVNLYEKYARAMGVFGIEEKRVFQVTPKGNTLVYLAGNGGDSVKKKERVKELRPVMV